MSNPAFPLLLSPLPVGPLLLRNRVVCAPHLTGLAQAGGVTDAQVAYYREKARGGAALVIFESTPVHPSGAGFERSVHPYAAHARPGLRVVADAVHEGGAAAVAQLWHCGRQGSSTVTGLPLWAPSSIPCPVNREQPETMTTDQIHEVERAFVAAASVFQEAGFDGVELAAGHGYLIQEFLSPLANVREDAYGGSAENRARFLLEIIDQLRRSCGRAFVLGIRLSADELLEGGYGLDESMQLMQWIVESENADYLSVSAGTHASVEQMVGDWSVPRGNLVHLARAAKNVSGATPVIASGRIVDPTQAEAILSAGYADLVGMARALIADSRWVAKAADGHAERIRPCIACNECERRLFEGLPIACAVNPTLSAAADAVQAASRRRRVLVVGGGPAGLEAARVAALRGHDVRLYEQRAALGGQLRLVQALGTRREFAQITEFLERELRRLQVDVRLSSRVELEDVAAAAPDAVIIATGPFAPAEARPDGSRPRVIAVEELVDRNVVVGRRVVLVDGGVSHDRLLAVAEALAERSKLYLLTPSAELGLAISFISLAGIRKRLQASGAELLVACEFGGIVGAGEVEFQAAITGVTRRLRGIDSVVMFAPQRAQTALRQELDGATSHVVAIGDCAEPRGLQAAFSEARAAALAL